MIFIPPQVIEKAIEGGWKPRVTSYRVAFEGLDGLRLHFKAFKIGREKKAVRQWYVSPYEIILMHSFWEGLAKSLGLTPWEWLKNSGELFDLILTNQPTEQFWRELLANPSL